MIFGVDDPQTLAKGTQPAKNAAAVTPSDTVNLTHETRALYISADGDIKVNTSGGQTDVVLAGLKAGMLLPLCVTRVKATGTTATVIALW